MAVIQLESSHAPLILGNCMQIPYLDNDNYSERISFSASYCFTFKMHVSFVYRILSSIGEMIGDCDSIFVRWRTITPMVTRPRSKLGQRHRSSLLSNTCYFVFLYE